MQTVMPTRRLIKEPFPALSHLLGVGLAIFGLVILLEKSITDRQIAASAIYGATLVMVFLASSLFHGLDCSDRLSRRLEQCDLAAIFLLIAGTYTPLCLLTIGGPIGWGLLSAEWLMALTGIWLVFFGGERSKWRQVALYLGMGWLFLGALGPLTSLLTNGTLTWLLVGGVFYSVGAVIFVLDRPHFWPGYFTAHDFWHVLVLGGSICHFIMVSRIVSLYKFDFLMGT